MAFRSKQVLHVFRVGILMIAGVVSFIKIPIAVSKSNLNVGVDIIEKNGQAYVVRGVGILDHISDIENTIVDIFNGNPVLVRNVATVREASAPRVGQTGLDNNDDVVEGIVVMRKGENQRIKQHHPSGRC